MANKPFSIRDVKRNALNKVLGIQKKKMVQKTNENRERAYTKYINEIKTDKTYPKEWQYGNRGWSPNTKDIDDELDLLIEELLREN